MDNFKWIIPKPAAVTGIVLVGLMTACTPMRVAPEQVASSQPTVTYKYQNDADLYQADQRAITFCNQYTMIPRPMNFSTDPDGSKVVIYDCVAAPAAIPLASRTPSSNLSYTYSSDQELLTASRNAQIHCMNNGMRQVASDTVLNANGTKTISFQCGPL